LDDCDFDDSYASFSSSGRGFYAPKLRTTFESPSDIQRNSKQRFESDGFVGKLPAMPLNKPVRQVSSRQVVDLRKQPPHTDTFSMTSPPCIPKRHIISSSEHISNPKSRMAPTQPMRQISQGEEW
jgi:hypothetical protein